MEHKDILMLKKAMVTVAALGLLLVLFYEKEPSFMDLQKQGPSTLTYFFENNIPSENFPDPYISSLYRPGDILYQPILDFQNGRKYLAIPKLKELSEAGNIDAMFWYAHNRMTQSVKTRYEGYNWFEKSAKLGNPYSALILDADSYYCNAYFESLCSKEWGKLAKESFKKRADAGDIRAKYYLERPTKYVRGEDFKKWVALVEESAKQNYFVPAMEFLKRFEDSKTLTPSQKEELLHIYRYLAKHNYVLGYDYLYVHSGYQDIFDKAIELGSDIQLKVSSRRCGNQFSELNEKSKIECLAKAYALEEMFNDDMWAVIPKPTDSETISTAKKAAKELISSMTPTIYIDEMHIDGGL
ncbi:sel1 repeat family protein [Enterovibrio norvegicus]|uniref:sel1 repeat family protein n=1 Tax=Enterovibrio norvegicus TaxID=188144 RepID=UPI00352E51DC